MQNRIIWIVFALLLPLTALQGQTSFEIPKSKVVRVINGAEYYIHTVEKGHTVYKISKSYNISPEELIRLNPDILNGLQIGMEILIPTGRKLPKQDPKPEPAQEPVPDTVAPPGEPQAPKQDTVIVKPCGTDPSVRKDVYEVALMMHFFLNEADQIDPEAPRGEGSSLPRSFQFIQFYEGFLMAVDSLKKTGLPVRLHVFDMSTDTVRTKRFLQEPGLKKMDLIVALLYHPNFQIVADFAREHAIPVVSPVSERASQVAGNPQVIKVRPSAESQTAAVARMVCDRYPASNLVIVRNPLSRFTAGADKLKDLLHDAPVTVTITDTKLMTRALKKDSLNVVIIYSETKSSILNLLTQLNGIKSQYQIAVVGLPDWAAVDGLEIDYLVNLKTHVVAPYFIDYTNERVKQFTRAFQSAVKTDPDPLAFIGYDVATFFLTALRNYGTSFPSCMNDMQADLLEAGYRFDRSGDNGYENQQWKIYYYEKYQLYDTDSD